MRERQDVAKIDWNKFPVEIREPRTWQQVFAKLRGADLGMVCVAAIAIAFAWVTKSTSLEVPVIAIVAVTVLGIVTSKQNRGADGPFSARSAENQVEPRHARRDQEAT